MAKLFAAFYNNLLPIFMAAGAGAYLGKKTQIDIGSFSRIILYVFTPSIIFKIYIDNPLPEGDILRMLGYTVVLMSGVIALMWLLGRAFSWDKSIIAAAMLASLATNAGNYGLLLPSILGFHVPLQSHFVPRNDIPSVIRVHNPSSAICSYLRASVANVLLQWMLW